MAEESEGSFTQVLFDEALRRHPELEDFQEALAKVVEYTVLQTHVHTRHFMMEKAVDALTMLYHVTKKRRNITKRQRASIKRNPALIHRNAVKKVEKITLNALAQLADLAEDEQDIPAERGNA